MPNPEERAQQKNRQTGMPQNAPHNQRIQGNGQRNHSNNGANRGKDIKNDTQVHQKREADNCKKKERAKTHPITKFIPQSVYNPETGKVFGFLSAEDLLIAAIILILLDGGSDDCGEDNSILIYALLYILISEHIDLPI